MGTSAALAALSSEEATDTWVQRLSAEGWAVAESSPCPNLSPGHFYEAETPEESREFYLATDGGAWKAGAAAWPEGNCLCHPIPGPSFIEEVQ